MTVPVLTTAAVLASSPPPLPGFLNALSFPLQHYGLWVIFFVIMLEDFGIPVPGETILIAGAVYAGAGRLNIVAVGVVGFIAAITGDNIGFAVGHFGGRALALRWGKHVFLTEERTPTTCSSRWRCSSWRMSPGASGGATGGARPQRPAGPMTSMRAQALEWPLWCCPVRTAA